MEWRIHTSTQNPLHSRISTQIPASTATAIRVWSRLVVGLIAQAGARWPYGRYLEATVCNFVW